MTYVIDPEGEEMAVIHELVDFRGLDVLEVGCGDGRLTWLFAEGCRSVLAIDPDEQEVDRAIAALPPALAGIVTFRTADVVTIELPAASFDLAVLAWSI